MDHNNGVFDLNVNDDSQDIFAKLFIRDDILIHSTSYIVKVVIILMVTDILIHSTTHIVKVMISLDSY